MVSVVIPTYNEEKTIGFCLESLLKQNIKDKEIIVIDDGSTDKTVEKVSEFKHSNPSKITLFKKTHEGPGTARNLGAQYAKGKILVFVDADMSFNEDFLRKLTHPIMEGKAYGTDSQDEYLANPDNFWARCWNMGRFAAANNFTDEYKVSMVPNKSDKGGIFRAILKAEFDKAHGFDPGGDYSDDESLARKLGKKATIVKGAFFYHHNPDSITDLWLRSSWIGRDRKLNSRLNVKLINLIKFFPLVAVFKGLITGIRFNYVPFIIFKIIYDSAIWISLVKGI